MTAYHDKRVIILLNIKIKLTAKSHLEQESMHDLLTDLILVRALMSFHFNVFLKKGLMCLASYRL